MTEQKKYKCVNCGEAAAALYRTYGPSVLKLTKCERCKGIVDKYIEYDPVIVMIDLVLMSREAQRHIIYNTEFKSYWKLLVVLIMLETYGVWRNDSLFNIAINTICNIKNNSTINSTHIELPVNLSIPEPWRSECDAWVQLERDTSDLFIWEKDFYVQFLSTFSVKVYSAAISIVIFISTVHILMRVFVLFSTINKAPLGRVLKSFSVSSTGLLLALPMLVWGSASIGSAGTRCLHYLLVFAYTLVHFYNMFTVLYEAPKTVTVAVLVTATALKYATTFHMTPFIRRSIT